MPYDVLVLKRLFWAAIVVAGLGVWAMLIQGADQPADPYLIPPDAPGDPARVPLEGFEEIALTVAPASGGDLLTWCLLAALRAEQRARGLMGVTDLQGYSGMAFVYDTDVENSFYMRNTPTPLSIAWIDANGQIVSTTDMAPCEDREGCPLYPSGGSYRTAIEVFQGDLDDLGIEPGARVTVGGPCAPRA